MCLFVCPLHGNDQQCRELKSFHVMQMWRSGSREECAEWASLGGDSSGRGRTGSALCAINSDTVAVTSAGRPGYIDYRTFNLITRQSVLTMGTGMYFYQMGFLVAVCPHWVP